ncbi:hypothetical protein K3U93_14450 [Mycobacterium malmoense]|uniref:PE-PGRS family protein n=1 Tax=Mycobacterium malmoense TaxID=1780 RepID=A0ABX3SLY3_MYCMA|nr:hypothetical protein [Mycobacterium malmoense]ORA77081.1 hypothetical protein BST29_24110 [Mycobacterium malmoense]QZA15941.1 hypothetical protein K3U93_14450 [Mycobacterium malmoense]UNB92754.1 hypothetical protein H5T25_14440 [Mycobacterium malmoense]
MQQLATLRPFVTAGAAAVGASLIALTPTVSTDAASDIQRSVVNAQHRAVALADDVVNPIQTWIDTLTTAGSNLQLIGDAWLQMPFPIAQQVAANWIQYASDYVGAYQLSAAGAARYFSGGNVTHDLIPVMYTALTDLRAGDIADALSQFNVALWTAPLIAIGTPLENILLIPTYMAQEFANASAGSINFLGLFVLLGLINTESHTVASFGEGIQGVYDALSAGDPLGVLTNLLNLPAVVTNGFLNGVGTPPTSSSGLLAYAGGPLNTELNIISQVLAGNIVAPDAQNIVKGGSLVTATQDFINQLVTGWPSLRGTIDSLVANLDQYLGYLGAANGGAAASVTDLAAISPAASTLTTELPGLSADVLKGFDPAMVTDIAGSLGPSLGADVTGTLGTMATTLSVDLSTLALHILSAL